MARASWYLTQTVRFTRRQLKRDAQGNPVRDAYQNDVYEEVDFDVPNCSWDPRESLSSENVDAAQQTVSGILLFCADPDAPVDAKDAAWIDGVKYEVEGEIARHRGSRMGNDHAAMVLKRVKG